MGCHQSPTTLPVTSISRCITICLLFLSIISWQITDYPLIICQNEQSFLPGNRNHDVATFLLTGKANLCLAVNRSPVVKGVCLSPRNFCQAWGQFSEVPRCLPCPFIPCPLSRYPYFLFVISISTVPLNSGIKLPTCSTGEQCCPLPVCPVSICTLLYCRCNLIIFKCELLLGSGNIT